MPNEPNYLIHVGNPAKEAPHFSMERCEKLHEQHPKMRLVLVVWDPMDKAELDAKVNKEKCDVLLWEDDSKLMGWLLDRLADMAGAQIVSPRWYTCGENHVTKGTYTTLLTECETCKGPVTLQEPWKEEIGKFAELFAKVITLANFDTRSGEFLYAAVNPTKNVILNAPYALGTLKDPAVQCRDLRGAAKGKAAFICGAGPSLEDAVPHLKRLQEKGVIICVGRAYRMLRDAGVRVDYTLSVEMFDWDAAIFENLGDVGDTVMAFASVCAPATVKAWPGKRVCLWDIETAKILGRDDYILGGNSVSHHMLNFAAQVLEAEPIVMVGIDLAYTKPKTHAEGTVPSGWPQEMQASDAVYQQEEWVPCTGKGDAFDPWCHRSPAVIVGGFLPSRIIEVRSSPAYKHFGTLFEVLIARHGKKTYNACPNGQKIAGAEYADLASFAA